MTESEQKLALFIEFLFSKTSFDEEGNPSMRKNLRMLQIGIELGLNCANEIIPDKPEEIEVKIRDAESEFFPWLTPTAKNIAFRGKLWSAYWPAKNTPDDPLIGKTPRTDAEAERFYPPPGTHAEFDDGGLWNRYWVSARFARKLESELEQAILTSSK